MRTTFAHNLNRLRPIFKCFLPSAMRGVLCAVAICLCGVAVAQRPYFVDGYHGGIYGHYPLEWKTQFITSTLEKHPDWRISLEIEPETWDSVALHTPQDYAVLKSMINSPRIEFTNPTYAQPYCYNISGESIIRQFTYGIKKIRSHFPDVEFVTYSVEEPCFTSSLPQILSHLGYKYASLKCPDTCWGGYTAAYGGETVNWISSDGSSILTSPRYECEELQENSVWQTTAWANHDNYVEACRKAGIAHPVGMCFQDAGWKNGPWVGYGKRARNQSQYVTWREYFEMLGIEKSEHDYHFTQEDVRPALMWGSQVLQRIAQQVRHSENIIPVAEKFATMAYLLDDDYTTPQAEMDEAWRTLMLAQHHDSWIVPYNNLHDKGSWANWIARWTADSDRRAYGVIADVQQAIAGKAWSSGDEATLRVWNTQGVRRQEVMTVVIPNEWQGYEVAVYNAEGKRVESAADMTHLSFVADAPSFGYTSYRLQKLNDRVAHEVANQDDCIENDMYRIRVDASRGGAISELIVKQGNKHFDYVDKNAERMMGELYGHFYDQQKFRSSTESPARVTVGRRGDLEQWLLIEGTISSHPFSQRITIRKGSPAIDIDLKIDWQHKEGIGEYRQRDSFSANERACYDDSYKLSLMFPTSLGEVVVDKNAPFDVCRSKLENTHFKSWDNIKNNVVLHWVDVVQPRKGGRGLALMTDHTTSYRHGKDEPLGLTVQYSGNGLWGRDYPLRGATSMYCAIVPHQGEWDEAGIEQMRVNRNEPLQYSLHVNAPLEHKSLLDVSNSTYEVVAMYPTQQGIVVRLYNASGKDKPQSIILGQEFASVAEIDLNDNLIKEYKLKVGKGKTQFSTSIPRFGFKTLLIEK